MGFQVAGSGSLPINQGRLIKTLADSTIGGVIDAIVELVTNSDDAYKRQEKEGLVVAGTINIYVTRTKGGKCSQIKVSDAASGMSLESLRKAIEFSGDTSGFKEGKTVRGFFGRGLKESIIALGEGIILTYKEGILSKAHIHYVKEQKDARYEIMVMHPTQKDLEEYGFSSDSGTIVIINVTEDKKNYIPASDTFAKQVEKHFALRDINSSLLRTIKLHVCEPEKHVTDSKYPIAYTYPSGRMVHESAFELEDCTLSIKIYETDLPLEPPTNSDGEAGLLIKTEGAVLDDRLFGFESEPAALYFFGEVVCPSIAKLIRDEGDESIVDFNRGGLNWKHEHNKRIQEILIPILRPLIVAKREKISSHEKKTIPENVDRALSDICKKLSILAKGLLEDELPGAGEVETFVIRPLFANIEAGKTRAFYVYCPKYLAEGEQTKIVEVASTNPAIVVVNEKITLGEYPKDSEVLYSSFKVTGNNNGDTSTIMASLGKLINTCEVRIAPLGKGGRKKHRKGGGGLFTKIIPSSEDGPIQRFSYSEGGIIRVYTKFPGVDKYLGNNFDKIDMPEGKTILAEILIEAFSRYISVRMAGRTISEDLFAVLGKMDNLRALCSSEIYDLVFNADFKKVLDI